MPRCPDCDYWHPLDAKVCDQGAGDLTLAWSTADRERIRADTDIAVEGDGSYLTAVGLALGIWLASSFFLEVVHDFVSGHSLTDAITEGENGLAVIAILALLVIGVSIATRAERQRGPKRWLGVAIGAFVAVLLLGAVTDLAQSFDASLGWFWTAVPLAVVTAAVIAWGLRVQRRDPRRRWPVIVVALIAGLVAGLAILQATWAESRWPERRRPIDITVISAAVGIVFLATFSAFQQPFGIGPQIEGGRIERAKAGFAITLPGGWRVEDISAARDPFGETLPTGMDGEFAATAADRSETVVAMTIDIGEPVTRATMALGLLQELGSDPAIEDVSLEPISLSVGDTFRLDMVRTGGGEMSLYPFTKDDTTFSLLYFIAADPPEDRWRSIAETFEFLPATGGVALDASEVPDEGRTEEAVMFAAEDGPRVTFPDNWLSEATSPEKHDWLYPDDPADIASRTPLRWAVSDTAICTLYDATDFALEAPAFEAFDDAVTYDYEWMSADADYEDVTKSYLDLPAGRSARIDWTDDTGGSHRIYYFTDGHTWIEFQCSSEKPPNDRWRSLAETFRFE